MMSLRPADVRAGRRPRVVVVAQGPPAQGGIATFARTIVEDPVLAADVDLTLLNTTREAVRAGGRLTPANLWHAVADAVRVARAARRAEVIHIQTALLPTLPLLRALVLCAAGRAGGARILVHVHSGRANSGQAEAFTPGSVTRMLLRGLRLADTVLTVSEAGAHALGPLVPGSPVETVDNAVDVAAFEPAPLDAVIPTVVFAGTLSRRKGLGDLAVAVRRLRDDGLAFELAVIGGANEVGDAEAEDVRAAFREAGFGASLLGPLAGDALRAHLHDADVFVLPSHWEGQPIAILEAMATGLPVVATQVGAIPDVVRDGIDGLLVAPHDVDALTAALRRVLTDVSARRAMGAAARARVADTRDLRHLRARLLTLYRAPARGRR
jgi:glycosyltransferase involved in cell wall biosynthesis